MTLHPQAIAITHELSQASIEIKELAQTIAGIVDDLKNSTARERFFNYVRLFNLADRLGVLSTQLEAALNAERGIKP